MGKETTNCQSGEQMRVTGGFSFSLARRMETKSIRAKLPKAARFGLHRMLGDSCRSLLSPDINLSPKRLLIFIVNLSYPIPGCTGFTQPDLLHSVRGTHISTPSMLVPKWHIAPSRVLACSKHNDNQESTHLTAFFSPCPFLVSQNTAEGGGM